MEGDYIDVDVTFYGETTTSTQVYIVEDSYDAANNEDQVIDSGEGLEKLEHDKQEIKTASHWIVLGQDGQRTTFLCQSSLRAPGENVKIMEFGQNKR